MQQDPLNVEMSKALAFLTRSQPGKAKPILLKLLKKRPKSADVLRNLALTCEQLRDIDESVRYIERAKKIDPNDPYVWSDAARLCKGAGRFADGLAYAQKALKLAPTNKDNVSLVAQALIWNGKYSEAIEMLESLMKQDSPPTGILNPWVTANFQLDNHEEVIRIATPIRDKTSSKMTYAMRREILSNLGLSLERLGRYEEAHEVFTEKNADVTNRYSIEESAIAIDQALAAWTPESFTSKRSTPLSESATPVFVLGFARSGTTLIERVIAAHPQASAAGECLFLSDAIKTRCPEDTPQMLYPTLAAELSDDDIERIRALYMRNLVGLTGKNDRIINKNLFLPRLGGLIGRCFPNAPLLVLRRNPEDIAVSVWSHAFNPTFNQWSMRLETIAHEIALFQRLIDHWKQVLPNPILEVNYEELTVDPEPHIRAIIDVVGLPWNEDCLSHESRKKSAHANRFIPTFSEHQVRKKINRSSVGRGERFGAALDPFREAYERYARP